MGSDPTAEKMAKRGRFRDFGVQTIQICSGVPSLLSADRRLFMRIGEYERIAVIQITWCFGLHIALTPEWPRISISRWFRIGFVLVSPSRRNGCVYREGLMGLGGLWGREQVEKGWRGWGGKFAAIWSEFGLSGD